jgi:tRNA threonylcarbamoyladenosine biosynthesis protein TsaE
MIFHRENEKILFEEVDLATMEKVAETILAAFPDVRVFLLRGNLGGGKTTLTQCFCRLLQCNDIATSPTYSIVQEYQSARGNSIFHIDLYRIQSEKEALEAGIEELVNSGEYCFVEWFDVAQNLIDNTSVLIKIEKTENDLRKITAEKLKR